MNEIKSARDTFGAWAKGWWFDECYEPCCSSEAKDAAWCAWEERSILVADMALALEMIAAEDDAARHNGTPLLTSGVRMTLDAALIKAGRKEPPVRNGD
ncbi:TPA: hypothetical protein ACXM9H_002963 [Burkholderia multivorans]|uniref:hypothetical protein n=1 Tax=Burkholderia multivorans TaxID=87883 RepID=UPI0021C19BC6|nr:hypothetical protein [Burkholderia multivorans]